MRPTGFSQLAIIVWSLAAASAYSTDDLDPNALADAERLISPDDFKDFSCTSESFRESALILFYSGVRKEIKAIDAHCKLTEDQKSQLQQTHIDEFNLWLQYAADVRTRHVGRPLTFMERRLADIEISFVRFRPHNPPIEPDGPFQKRVIELMSLDQVPGYADYQRERRAKQLAEVWKRLEDRKYMPVKLSPEHRDEAIQILMEHAPPLPGRGEYADLIMLLQVDQLKDRVQPVLTEEEWKQFQATHTLAVGMQPYLQTFKLWPVRDPNQRDQGDQ